MILHDLLNNAVLQPSADLQWGEETARLPNPIDVTLGLWKPALLPPLRLYPYLFRLANAFGAHQVWNSSLAIGKSPHIASQPPYSFPVQERWTPDLYHRQLVVLPSNDLERFHATCSRRGFTISEMISVALNLAQFTVLHRHHRILDTHLPDIIGSTSPLPIDTRRLLKDGPAEHIGFGTYFALVRIVVETIRKVLEASRALDTGAALTLTDAFWVEFGEPFRKNWRDIKVCCQVRPTPEAQLRGSSTPVMH